MLLDWQESEAHRYFDRHHVILSKAQGLAVTHCNRVQRCLAQCLILNLIADANDGILPIARNCARLRLVPCTITRELNRLRIERTRVDTSNVELIAVPVAELAQAVLEVVACDEAVHVKPAILDKCHYIGDIEVKLRIRLLRDHVPRSTRNTEDVLRKGRVRTEETCRINRLVERFRNIRANNAEHVDCRILELLTAARYDDRDLLCDKLGKNPLSDRCLDALRLADPVCTGTRRHNGKFLRLGGHRLHRREPHYRRAAHNVCDDVRRDRLRHEALQIVLQVSRVRETLEIKIHLILHSRHPFLPLCLIVIDGLEKAILNARRVTCTAATRGRGFSLELFVDACLYGLLVFLLKRSDALERRLTVLGNQIVRKRNGEAPIGEHFHRLELELLAPDLLIFLLKFLVACLEFSCTALILGELRQSLGLLFVRRSLFLIRLLPLRLFISKTGSNGCVNLCLRVVLLIIGRISLRLVVARIVRSSGITCIIAEALQVEIKQIIAHFIPPLHER
nr:MAG TPA: hypothetical protein [Caudoviricetes sp.]